MPTSDTAQILIPPETLVNAPQLRATSDLVLGENGAGVEFGRISGIATDELGRLYVLDSYNYCVFVFDHAGHFVRSIGKKGAGPGEFVNPHGPTTLRTGNGVAVHDNKLFVLDRRLLVFDSTGRFVDSSPPEIDFTSVTSITDSPDGIILETTRVDDERYLRYRFTRYNIPARNEPGIEVVQWFFDSGGHMHRAQIPLPNLVFDVSSGGRIYFASGPFFNIKRISFDGQQTLYHSNTPRVSVVASDVDDFIATSIERIKAHAPASETNALQPMIAQFDRNVRMQHPAKYRNAIGMIITSADGNILARRTDIGDHPYAWTDGSRSEWDLLQNSGRLLGRLLLPTKFVPKIFRNCELTGTLDSTNGATLLVRFKFEYPTSVCSK